MVAVAQLPGPFALLLPVNSSASWSPPPKLTVAAASHHRLRLFHGCPRLGVRQFQFWRQLLVLRLLPLLNRNGVARCLANAFNAQ